MKDSINNQLKNIYIKVFKDINEISFNASQLFKSIHTKSSSCIYIIPGGKTPLLFYKSLAKKIDNWKNSVFILSDERIVSSSSKLSNSYHFHKFFLNQIKSKTNSKLFFIEFINQKNYKINIKSQITNRLRKLNRPDIAIPLRKANHH